MTVKSVKIDDEVFPFDVVKRDEKRFVFEIMRVNGNRMVASSEEHKKAKRPARGEKKGLEANSQGCTNGKARPISPKIGEVSALCTLSLSSTARWYFRNQSYRVWCHVVRFFSEATSTCPVAISCWMVSTDRDMGPG